MNSFTSNKPSYLSNINFLIISMIFVFFAFKIIEKNNFENGYDYRTIEVQKENLDRVLSRNAEMNRKLLQVDLNSKEVIEHTKSIFEVDKSNKMSSFEIYLNLVNFNLLISKVDSKDIRVEALNVFKNYKEIILNETNPLYFNKAIAAHQNEFDKSLNEKIIKLVDELSIL